MNNAFRCLASAFAALFLALVTETNADPPFVTYIFPAGGQQGSTVDVKVGGHCLHEGAEFDVFGQGISATKRVERTKTIWFEGPRIPMPASQRKEDYPKDYAGKITIANDANLGARYWRVSTSQGVTPRMKFVVGDLPEIVEQEIDGAPIPVAVEIPTTINGRIFPREDVDIWNFDLQKGEAVSCEVLASRLGSGLDSRLEIRDPQGRNIAENVDTFGVDSFVQFKAKSSGTYSCRIHDINYGGLQHFVYRLTIRKGPAVEAVYPLGGQQGQKVDVTVFGQAAPSSPFSVVMPKKGASFQLKLPIRNSTSASVILDLDKYPESLEQEPNDFLDTDESPKSFKVPQTLNGIINRPGDVDTWQIDAIEGDTIELEVFASRHGTLLDSVIEIVDGAGKVAASNDDLKNGEPDSKLTWKVPPKGPWFLRIRDQLETRGGSRFAYRIKATKPAGPGYQLTLPVESLTLLRGNSANLKINVQRIGGFQEPIELHVEGLPKGVTVDGTKIAAKKNAAQLKFTAAEDAQLGVTELKITGHAKSEDLELTRQATFPVAFGDPPIETMSLAVGIPTPFKFVGPYEMKYVSRGTSFSRAYTIERNGFSGEIEIEMADRQARHLQGVTGAKIVVPKGKSDFVYTIALPPWMEVGRTSRTTLQASAFVTDETGKRHRVSYSSQAQDDQIILLVDPVRLSVSASRQSVSVKPGSTINLPITVNRGSGLSGDAVVDIHLAEHIQGVSAESIVIPKDKKSGDMKLKISNDPARLGPFNMPVVIRATVMDSSGPVVGEFRLALSKSE